MKNYFKTFMKKYGLDSIFSPADLNFLDISNKDALKSDMRNVANDMHKILKSCQ